MIGSFIAAAAAAADSALPEALRLGIASAATAVLVKGADWLFGREQFRSQAKLNEAEADGAQVRTLMSTLDLAWQRADDLEAKVDYLNVVVDALLGQLRAAGLTPAIPPRPPADPPARPLG